jgi:molybdopterin-biosynthesis enzyme MoeA-like protein
MTRETITSFGLIIVGNEILDGRREDAHFAYARDLLKQRDLGLAYSLFLPDDAVVIETHLRWAMARSEPFFCCGGIGSTPDDLTRDCAARAAGVALEHHAEGVAILKACFGGRATPSRLRMVEFPSGASLIPNPVNRVPGFRIRNGYFLPGFPEMAQPMMRWVLEQYYLAPGRRCSATVVLNGVKEADLVELMEAFVAGHEGVSFSSLPQYTDTGTRITLGLSGLEAAVEAGLSDLTAQLEEAGIAYENENT